MLKLNYDKKRVKDKIYNRTIEQTTLDSNWKDNTGKVTINLSLNIQILK